MRDPFSKAKKIYFRSLEGIEMMPILVGVARLAAGAPLSSALQPDSLFSLD